MRVFLRRRHSLRVSYLLIALLVLLGGAAGTPSVSHAQAPTPTPAPSPAPTPAPTPAPVPSPTPPPRPTPTPTPAPPPRVLAIEVVGNRHIPTEQILAVITLKVGDILTPEQLRRDGEAVAGLGWFADVSLRVESDPAGVRVVFLLVENPVITEVVVEGNTVIGTPEILRALNIPIGQVLNSKSRKTTRTPAGSDSTRNETSANHPSPATASPSRRSCSGVRMSPTFSVITARICSVGMCRLPTTSMARTRGGGAGVGVGVGRGGGVGDGTGAGGVGRAAWR